MPLCQKKALTLHMQSAQMLLHGNDIFIFIL